MDMMLWNILLTGAFGIAGWVVKTMWSEQQRLQVLLNRTREEIAKDYVTKQEVHNDINRIVDRLEALDAKIDRLIERTVR